MLSEEALTAFHVSGLRVGDGGGCQEEGGNRSLTVAAR